MPVTNLRKLREARRIPLRELSAASGLSGQYINRMELREIPATPRMERQLSNAVSALIIARKKNYCLWRRTSWHMRAAFWR